MSGLKRKKKNSASRLEKLRGSVRVRVRAYGLITSLAMHTHHITMLLLKEKKTKKEGEKTEKPQKLEN